MNPKHTPEAHIEYISDEALEADLSATPKPTAYEHHLGYPLGSLTDRQFECLLHDLFKADVSDSHNKDIDNVILMQAVGERGRDCALLLAGVHVGVVQCKKYEALMTKPACAREIIKFVLHAIKDPTLIPKADEFRYVFAVSNNFNEPAAMFLADFNRQILNEPKLEAWVNEVIGEYKSLEDLTYVGVETELRSILSAIKLEHLNFNDINTKLTGKDTIVAKFFTIKKVVSEERLEGIETAVQKLLSNQISDEDVSRLASRLQALAADRRFDTGLVSFWGYPKEFLETLAKEKKLQPILLAFVGARIQVDSSFIEFLRFRIQDEVLLQITTRGSVSPFTIQAAIPYLVGRLGNRLRRAQLGSFMSGVGTAKQLMDDPIA
ncbi:MAG: hypothetical protein ACRC6G_09330, partial [Deefgea sp.]